MRTTALRGTTLNTSKYFVRIIIYLVFIYVFLKAHEAYPGTGFIGLILALLLLHDIVKISIIALQWNGN